MQIQRVHNINEDYSHYSARKGWESANNNIYFGIFFLIVGFFALFWNPGYAVFIILAGFIFLIVGRASKNRIKKHRNLY